MKKPENIIDKIAICMRLEETPDDVIMALIVKTVQHPEQRDRDGRTLLINAVFCGRRKLVEWLIASRADVNAQDVNGFSALHAAVQERNVEIASILLQNGADVNLRDRFGNPPICRTDLATPPELFRLLLENGADVGLKNEYGVSCRDAYAAYPDRLALFDEYSRP